MTPQNRIKRNIKITSEAEFGKQMKSIMALFTQRETEETWEDFSAAFKCISSWIKEDHVTEYESFGTYVKELKLAINRSLGSQRTRLSSVASATLRDMAESMTLKYRKLNDLFVQTIIEQFRRTNKTHTKCILDDYKAIIKASKIPNTIPICCELLTSRIKHKNNANLRVCVGECLISLLDSNNEATISKYKTVIEKTIQTASLDSNANVRAVVRQCYATYCGKMPNAVGEFEKKLTSQQLKYLHQTITSKNIKAATVPTIIPKKTKIPTVPTIASRNTKVATVPTIASRNTNATTTPTMINSNRKNKVAVTDTDTNTTSTNTTTTGATTTATDVSTNTTSTNTTTTGATTTATGISTNTISTNATKTGATTTATSTIKTTNSRSSKIPIRKTLWKNRSAAVSKLAQNKRVQVSGLMRNGVKKSIGRIGNNNKILPKNTEKDPPVKSKKRSASVAFGNEENIDNDKQLRKGVGGLRRR